MRKSQEEFDHVDNSRFYQKNDATEEDLLHLDQIEKVAAFRQHRQMQDNVPGNEGSSPLKTTMRIFPGPVGDLQRQLAHLSNDAEQEKLIETLTQRMHQETVHTPVGKERAAKKKYAESPEVQPKVYFETEGWRKMVDYVQFNAERQKASPPQTSNLLQKYNIQSVTSGVAFLRKVKLLALVIKSVIKYDQDAHVNFADPTGDIEGTICKKMIDNTPHVLNPGCVLLLKRVSIYSPSPKRFHIIVTSANVVQIWVSDVKVHPGPPPVGGPIVNTPKVYKAEDLARQKEQNELLSARRSPQQLSPPIAPHHVQTPDPVLAPVAISPSSSLQQPAKRNVEKSSAKPMAPPLLVPALPRQQQQQQQHSTVVKNLQPEKRGRVVIDDDDDDSEEMPRITKRVKHKHTEETEQQGETGIKPVSPTIEMDLEEEEDSGPTIDSLHLGANLLHVKQTKQDDDLLF